MGEITVTELSGRIEGLARAFLVLSATLHRQDALDEQLLQAKLRAHADGIAPEMTVAKRTLEDLADQLLRDYLAQQGKAQAGP